MIQTEIPASSGADRRSGSRSLPPPPLPPLPRRPLAARTLGGLARLERPFERRLAWLACVALLAATVGCGGGAADAKKKAEAEAAADKPIEPVVVTVAEVAARPIQRRVSVVGTLNGFERIVITPKVEGRVEAIKHETGDRVKPGDVLLEIDRTDYQLAAQEAERALEMDLARLGLETPPEGPVDMQQQPAIVRAQLLLENAKRRFDRQKSLLSSNVASRETFEQTETDLKVAEATLKQSSLETQATVASVRHKQAVLAQSRQRLQESIVVAPRLDAFPVGDAAKDKSFDYVIAKRMTAVGEMVRAFPSTPVFELVVDDMLKLRANVPERFAGVLKMDQQVEVRVEAYPDEVFAAHVSRLHPTVDPQNRTFEIEALVPNRDHRLKHGGFAKAEVLTRVDEAGRTAPLETLVRFAGVSKVFRIRDGKAQEVLVEVGARGDGWIELIGGLELGDQLVTSGQSRLAEGTPVRIREASAQAENEGK